MRSALKRQPSTSAETQLAEKLYLRTLQRCRSHPQPYLLIFAQLAEVSCSKSCPALRREKKKNPIANRRIMLIISQSLLPAPVPTSLFVYDTLCHLRPRWDRSYQKNGDDFPSHPRSPTWTTENAVACTPGRLVGGMIISNISKHCTPARKTTEPWIQSAQA